MEMKASLPFESSTFDGFMSRAILVHSAKPHIQTNTIYMYTYIYSYTAHQRLYSKESFWLNRFSNIQIHPNSQKQWNFCFIISMRWFFFWIDGTYFCYIWIQSEMVVGPRFAFGCCLSSVRKNETCLKIVQIARSGIFGVRVRVKNSIKLQCETNDLGSCSYVCVYTRDCVCVYGWFECACMCALALVHQIVSRLVHT